MHRLFIRLSALLVAPLLLVALGAGLATWTLSGSADAQLAGFHEDLSAALERLDRARGDEGYAALRRLWHTWDRAQPLQVEEALRAASVEPKLAPPVRAYARMLRAYARLRRGDLARARAELGELGFVDQWLVLGPFDDEGKAGFAAQLEPELTFAEPVVGGKAYSGKERPVRWRSLPPVFPYGYVDTRRIVRPDKRVCVFLRSFVQDARAATQPRPIGLWVGSGGAVRAYWNGTLVLEDAAYRGHDADRLATTVVLEPGTNDLLLKVCGDDEAPLVSARLTEPSGERAAGVRAQAELGLAATVARDSATRREGAQRPGSVGPSSDAALREPASRALGHDAAPGARAPLRQTGPLPRLREAALAKHATVRQMQAYAEYLTYTGGDDPALHEARDLAARAAEADATVDRLLLAAELAEDRNQRARWLNRADALPGAERQARRLWLARAEWLRGGPAFLEAFTLYARVLERWPDDVEALQGRTALYNDAGLERSALAQLDAAVRRNPSSVALLNMVASQLREVGRTTEASEAEARYGAVRFDDRQRLEHLIDVSSARRDRAAAEHWVARLLELDPEGAWAHDVAARTYRFFGQPERALAAYEASLALAPEDVDVLRALADLHGDLGHRDEQVSLLRRVLELKPQDADVRQYVEYLEPTAARDDEKYAWKPERFEPLRHAPAAGENHRALVDLTVTTVYETGLSSSFRQVVFQPLTDAAAALARNYAFQYQADRQRVQLRGARVFRGDGRVDEAIESGEGAADDPSVAMYTSARTFYVHLPRLEPGDVVELRYRIDDVATNNELAGYFGDLVYLQDRNPVRHAEYVVIAPKSRPLHVEVQKLPTLKRTVTEQGKNRIYRFVAEDLAAVRAEPAMPPWPAVLGFVHVSTYRTWRELGEWYWGLVREQFDLDDQTRRLARQIAAGTKTDLDKVKAVYRWVIENTRYVALELGIYGYKPRRCVQTVSRGWGDCKDKATVIVTLLRELGIDATIVIVRTGLRGRLDPQIASLAPFDHAIAYVPSLDLYLDGTAEYAGSTELPAMDAGALAVLVNQGNPRLVHLPEADPSVTVRRRHVEASLSASGEASLQVRFEAVGSRAPEWRRRYHGEATRRDRLSEDLGRTFPGFRIAPGPAAIDVKGLDDLERPVQIGVRGSSPSFARREGKDLSMAVTFATRLTPEYASLSRRELPVEIGAFGSSEETVSVTLPSGMVVRSAPPEVHAKSRFGEYSVKVVRSAGLVTVDSRVSLSVSQVLPADYADFKRFCSDVDQAMTPRLVVGAP